MSQIHDAPNNGSTYSTPFWVKAFGIVALAVILLVVVALVTGAGGEHGPGRHTPADGSGEDTPSIEQGLQPNVPVGHTPPVAHGGGQP
jgi:hypothetical protein